MSGTSLEKNLQNFSLTLKKQHALLNQVRTLLSGEKEVTDKYRINQELECFYKSLFTEISLCLYPSQINVPGRTVPKLWRSYN